MGPKGKPGQFNGACGPGFNGNCAIKHNNGNDPTYYLKNLPAAEAVCKKVSTCK